MNPAEPGYPIPDVLTPSPRCGRPRLVAVDYDGTLTIAGRPADDVLAALARARGDGLALVLVSGRILDELVVDFPDVGDHFDALVLENGAQVEIGNRRLLIAPPIDSAVSVALTARNIDHRRGKVIVAASASDEHAIVDEMARLGLECQLVHNRTELMVLPSGVNKGVGLVAALRELGISRHDTVAVGDAENDHSFLASAELGVAVANAVDSLRATADVVLDRADGEGIIDLVNDLTDSGNLWRRRRRPQLILGRDTSDQPVRIPAHPANLIVAGGSGDGKSYLAGLMAEQLIDLGYSTIVIDPEGDHIGLNALRPAVLLGADGPPPPPDVVVNLLKPADACVIVDLSALTIDERRHYLAELPAAVEACRRATGRPHWVLIDEAHNSITSTEATLGAIDLEASGYCLITWLPDELPPPIMAGTDMVLALTSPDPDPHIVDLVAAVARVSRRRVVQLLTAPTGSVLVASRADSGRLRLAGLGTRHTHHFRHEHKYDAEGTPPHRAFWFRDVHDRPTGAVAHNLHELRTELSHCSRSALRHHGPLGDFSRWVDNVFHNRSLAARMAVIESAISPSSPAAVVDAARLELIQALQQRHRPSTDGADGR